MRVNNINFASDSGQKPIVNIKNTGYAGVAGMGLAILTGFSRNKSVRKTHGLFAGFSALAVATHLYLINDNRKKYRRSMQANSDSKF